MVVVPLSLPKETLPGSLPPSPAQLIATSATRLPQQPRSAHPAAPRPPLSPTGIVSQRTGGPAHVSKGSVSGKIHVQGSNANTTHTINEDERTEFTRHINAVLAGDPDIGSRLPFATDTFEMFDECKDGLVLAKLINDSVPDNHRRARPQRAGQEDQGPERLPDDGEQHIVIESAKGIGCSVVNIGSGDMIEVREHLILGLIWQIIRRGLLGKIDIKLHPELYRLLEEDETLEQFLPASAGADPAPVVQLPISRLPTGHGGLSTPPPASGAILTCVAQSCKLLDRREGRRELRGSHGPDRPGIRPALALRCKHETCCSGPRRYFRTPTSSDAENS